MVAFILFECVKYLVIYNLIRVVIIICKNRNTAVIKMLQYCSGSSRTSALTVFALAYDIHTAVVCTIDKCGNVGSFGEISIVCISLASQDIKVKVIQFAVKNCIADTTVIYMGIFLVDTLYRRIVKADNSSILRKVTGCNNGFDGFS